MARAIPQKPGCKNRPGLVQRDSHDTVFTHWPSCLPLHVYDVLRPSQHISHRTTVCLHYIYTLTFILALACVRCSAPLSAQIPQNHCLFALYLHTDLHISPCMCTMFCSPLSTDPTEPLFVCAVYLDVGVIVASSFKWFPAFCTVKFTLIWSKKQKLRGKVPNGRVPSFGMTPTISCLFFLEFFFVIPKEGWARPQYDTDSGHYRPFCVMPPKYGCVVLKGSYSRHDIDFAF